MYKYVFGFALILMAGCSNFQVYEGGKRAESEVVIIRGMSNLDISAGGYAAKICGIDGNEFQSCKPFIEFLPGERTLTLKSSYMGVFSKKVDVKKEFTAGDRYLLGLKFIAPANERPVLMYRGNINEPKK